MPFIAEQDGRTVIPEEVADGDDVICPTCQGVMRPRGPFKDGTARHFYHVAPDAGGSGCKNAGTGESDTHRKWKSLAVSALRQAYDGQYSRCAPEVALDVSETATAVDERRADAFLEFREENRFFGNGIIVEVQHLNVEKDVRGTTHDYLQQGYSVYWATAEEFANDRFAVKAMETAFNDGAPPAFSAYRDVPPVLDAPEPLPVAADDDVRYTTTDPVPACKHEFVPHAKTGRVCVRCGLQIVECVFDEERGRLRPEESLNLMLDRDRREGVFAADMTSIDRPVSIAEIETYGDPPDHAHVWGQVRDLFAVDKYSCRNCKSVLLIAEMDGRIVIRHEEDEDDREFWEELEGDE